MALSQRRWARLFRDLEAALGCPANPDGVHRAWHDEGSADVCRCGKELP